MDRSLRYGVSERADHDGASDRAWECFKRGSGLFETTCVCRIQHFYLRRDRFRETTFLNALSDYIPKDERIITIEDNAELQIQGVENLVRLEARKENTEENMQLRSGI